MIPRRTSADALRAITESGRLAESKKAVYRWLFEHGPATRNELDRALGEGNPNPTFSRRLTELEALGVVSRVGQRRCMVTDHNADLWDVTDGLPSSDLPPKKPSQAARVRLFLSAVRAELSSPKAKVFPDNVLTRVRELVDRFEKEEAA